MKHSLYARLLKDRAGNFGIMTAAMLPVLLGGAGLAIDMTNAMVAKSSLQGIVDAAALGAAAAMSGDGLTPSQAEAMGLNILMAQIGRYVDPDTDEESAALEEEIKRSSTIVGTESGTISTGKTYGVTITTSYDLPLSPMSALFGYSTMKVAVNGSAVSTTAAKNAFSMYLVLDRSGSMDEATNTRIAGCTGNSSKCFVKKMDALKVATDSLLQTIKDADPENKYARLGAVSYNNVMQTPTVLDWGTDSVKTYVQALKSSGTTNSGEATATAYTSLAKVSETTAHTDKNGQTKPAKYIILMTDGANNISGADAKTKTACTSAKTAGIEVYTVAFMAPTAGKSLLSQCATDASHYFDADNAAQLVAAFKAIGEKASQVGTRLTN